MSANVEEMEWETRSVDSALLIWRWSWEMGDCDFCLWQRTVWVHCFSSNLENRDLMLDMEKVLSGKALGMIMAWGPWVFALIISSSPRIFSRSVFLRDFPPSWGAQAWSFSTISIHASHSLGQKGARSVLAVCLYLRKSGYRMSQHHTTIFRFPTSLLGIKHQREIHNFLEKYQPVLCSLRCGSEGSCTEDEEPRAAGMACQINRLGCTVSLSLSQALPVSRCVLRHICT